MSWKSDDLDFKSKLADLVADQRYCQLGNIYENNLSFCSMKDSFAKLFKKKYFPQKVTHLLNLYEDILMYCIFNFVYINAAYSRTEP
jgi:hypothetical protein